MNESDRDRLFIITGGPGSGKSSLIEALSRRGIATMPEAGRAIIQDQVSIGGEALPWMNRVAFAELMLSWELRSHRAALELHEPVAFDRGVPDVAGYLRLIGMPVPLHVRRAIEIYRYHSPVFIAPPWREIYTGDEERKQSYEEAEATYEALRITYAESGYELVHLPLVPVEARVQFVMETMGLTWTFHRAAEP